MPKVKVLFYYWDWRDRPEMKPIQRAIDAVFDGTNAPYLTGEVPTADWDQNTVAICATRIDSVYVGKAFDQYMRERDNDGSWCWWELDRVPVPLEIDI